MLTAIHCLLLLLAYPKFAWPFDWPTHMKIPRTAPDGQLNLAHGPETKKIRKNTIKNRVAYMIR